MPKYRVTVTSEDLATSMYEDIIDCALAKALKRKFPDKKILVGGSSFDIDDVEYPISNSAREKLRNGCGKPNQEPITFYFTLN